MPICLHELLMGGLISVVEKFKAKQVIPCACLKAVSLEVSFKEGTEELFAERQQEH